MKISVIGLGYLGATHAVAMASLGHEVIGIEPDSIRTAQLKAGKIPFHEPGLQQALDKVLAAGNISFQNQHDDQSAAADIHFICVGTPQAADKSADTSFVFAAAAELAKVLKPESLVVGKSTVPVGVARKLISQMAAISGFEPKLCWNPEFLREGTALEDSLHPDRIVVGSNNHQDTVALRECYKPMLDSGTPLLEVDLETSELVKVSANAFLATKISFINAMAEIAEASGADAVKLAEAIGMDNRIGSKFLRTGIGFGGGCLPKDIRGFIARADELGVGSSLDFLKDVDAINLRRRQRVIDLVTQELKDLRGKKITMLGISFKPDSDDLRDSPALEIAVRLKELGAAVCCHDPISLDALHSIEPDLKTEADIEKAIADADLVILGTEWSDYRKLQPAAFTAAPKTKTIIDGRNVLDVDLWQAAGWKVLALGRNIQNA
ncbi:MAG: UDP-glucose/GDP-mannose dehydrogenase family protein [Aquiluna sp.]|nr:UDP-glucose/GDP-mannose dehydrogenase family protein [Aquiluna sp.]